MRLLVGIFMSSSELSDGVIGCKIYGIIKTFVGVNYNLIYEVIRYLLGLLVC